MAGKGERFSKENFFRPKPLIELDGKPIIEYVIDIFSRDCEFIFVCNKLHLQNTNLEEVLTSIVPDCMIIGIDDSDAEIPGPVHTASFAFDLIDDDEEVIVSYCDHDMVWDFQHFLQTVRATDCDAAIPCFKGFHPGLLSSTYYGYVETDTNNHITYIEEKKPIAGDRFKNYTTSAVHYFKKGCDFKKYCNVVLDNKINVSGEAYMTLPFKHMIDDGLKIINYEVQKNIFLGTPRDYEQFKFWSEFFFLQSRGGYNNLSLSTTNIFPIAGNQRNFKELGINKLDFMIPLMNKPLIEHTIKSYPTGIKNIFIALEENKDEIDEHALEKNNPNTEIIWLDKKTDSIAETILKAEKSTDPNSPICISGSTNIITYDQRRLYHLFEDPSVDVILLSFTHHENVLRNPKKYGYARIKGREVVYLSEKETISDNPYKDHAMTGIVIYKKASNLFSSIKHMFKSKEYTFPGFITAVNQLIKEGKKVVTFEVDHFVSLSTPNDYQEFIYWQDYFHNLRHHPYNKI